MIPKILGPAFGSSDAQCSSPSFPQRRAAGLHFLVNALRAKAVPFPAKIEWNSQVLLEKQTFVTRLALGRVREIVTIPLPHAADVSTCGARRARVAAAGDAICPCRGPPAEKQY